MKTTTLISVGFLVLFIAGCVKTDAPANEASEKRIAALETKVESLERKAGDLSLKGRIVASNLFGSPVENFLGEEGWWENPYDVSQVQCAKACIATATAHRKVCAAMKEDAERLTCYQEASTNAATCQRQCSRFPPPQ